LSRLYSHAYKDEKTWGLKHNIQILTTTNEVLSPSDIICTESITNELLKQNKNLKHVKKLIQQTQTNQKMNALPNIVSDIHQQNLVGLRNSVNTILIANTQIIHKINLSIQTTEENTEDEQMVEADEKNYLHAIPVSSSYVYLIYNKINEYLSPAQSNENNTIISIVQPAILKKSQKITEREPKATLDSSQDYIASYLLPSHHSI
jgi:hypothetical protein